MGANITKKETISETVNNIVNETVNKTVNSFKSTAQANQSMEFSCTDEQFKLAIELKKADLQAYNEAYEIYLKYGSKGEPPKKPELELCVAKGVSQKSIISLNSNNETKNGMVKDIDNQLSNIADLISKSTLTDSFGYSDTELKEINKIVTNIKNKTYNETLNETVNNAIANQNIKSSGTGLINVSQETTVNLISGSIIENITKDSNKAIIKNTAKTINEFEKKNPISEMFNTLVNGFVSFAQTWIGAMVFIALGFFLLVAFVPGVLCFIPGAKMVTGCGEIILDNAKHKNSPIIQKKYT